MKKLDKEVEKTWKNPGLIEAGATIAEYMGKNKIEKLQLPIGIVAISNHKLVKEEAVRNIIALRDKWQTKINLGQVAWHSRDYLDGVIEGLNLAKDQLTNPSVKE